VYCVAEFIPCSLLLVCWWLMTRKSIRSRLKMALSSMPIGVEHCGRMVNNLLLHIPEVPGSILGPSDKLSWLRFFVVIPVAPGHCLATTASYQILSNSSFTYNLSSTLCSLVTVKASLNKISSQRMWVSTDEAIVGIYLWCQACYYQ
jgi:hypothetical protein